MKQKQTRTAEPLCLVFRFEHFLIRFKKYKQAGSHSNSFRLSNGRTEDVGKAWGTFVEKKTDKLEVS